jgi:hypothetical protein
VENAWKQETETGSWKKLNMWIFTACTFHQMLVNWKKLTVKHTPQINNPHLFRELHHNMFRPFLYGHQQVMYNIAVKNYSVTMSGL